MIISFKHKGLELFYYTGNKKGINPDHYKKVARILDRLDASKNPKDMNLVCLGKRKLENNFSV